MHKLISAAAFVAALAVPAAASAQQDAPRQTSPFAALELAEELQLTAQQQSAITVARDSLREAHRIHCAPMHASTPTEAEEARHHAEMALINARWETAARGAMTPVQLERLAVLRPAPAAQEHAEEHHDEPAAAAGHGGHHPAPAAAPAAPAAAHGGHHPAPTPAATPAQGHAGHPQR